MEIMPIKMDGHLGMTEWGEVVEVGAAGVMDPVVVEAGVAEAGVAEAGDRGGGKAMVMGLGEGWDLGEGLVVLPLRQGLTSWNTIHLAG